MKREGDYSVTTPKVRETALSARAQEGSSGVTKGGEPAHNKCGHTPAGLCGGVHLNKKLYSYLGRVLGQVPCEKRNKIIGQIQTKALKDGPM